MDAPTAGEPCKLLASAVKMTSENGASELTELLDVSAYPVKQNNPLTTTVNGLRRERETGFEPATSSLGSNNTTDVTYTDKGLTSTPSPACTAACTSEAENVNADAPNASQGNAGEGIVPTGLLSDLAAIAAKLSPADRARLTQLLQGE